jgi:4-oxalocrotonate tautomerase family enzyme
MPHIVVNGPHLKDLDKKRVLVEEITGVAQRVYDLPKESIRVVIREDEPTNVASGGVLQIDRK